MHKTRYDVYNINMKNDIINDEKTIAIEDIATQIWNTYEVVIEELLNNLSNQLFKTRADSCYDHDSVKVLSLIQSVGKIATKDDTTIGSLALAEKVIEYKYELCRLIYDVVNLRKEHLNMLLSMKDDTVDAIKSSGIGNAFNMKLNAKLEEYENTIKEKNINPTTLLNEYTILNSDIEK